MPADAGMAVDVETASVFRGLSLAGTLPARRADLAIADLAALPLERIEHRSLLARCWEQRTNLTIYDAADVALAELLAVNLVTADARKARAPGVTCTVEILSV